MKADEYNQQRKGAIAIANARTLDERAENEPSAAQDQARGK